MEGAEQNTYSEEPSGRRLTRREAMERLRRLRTGLQLAQFWFWGKWLYFGVVRCPFVVPFVACDHCPLHGCPGTWLRPWTVRLLLLSSLLAGRVFCAWTCPLGFLQDRVGKFGAKKAPVRGAFPHWDAALKWLKYGFLVFILLLIYGGLTQSSLDLPLSSHRPPPPSSVAPIRILLAFGALLASLVVVRAWCRYLCPLGALVSFCNRFSLLTLRRDLRKCTACGLYPRDCPTYTTPGTLDCIACGECVYGCPREAITFGPRIPRLEPPTKRKEPP